MSGNYEADDADAVVAGHDYALLATQNTAATVGDVDGDGLDDMLAGAPNANVGTDASAGIAYLMSGTEVATGSDTRFSLATFVGTADLQRLGTAAVTLGDVDGDGNVDVLASGDGDSTYVGTGGAAYVWYGPARGALTAADAGAVFYGSSEQGLLGENLHAGHDLTGDP